MNVDLMQKYKTNKMRIDKLLKQLKWFNDFADKLEQEDLEMYLKSCEYADQKERDEIFQK